MAGKYPTIFQLYRKGGYIPVGNLRGKRVPGQLLFKSKQLLIRYFMSSVSVFGLRFCGIRGVVESKIEVRLPLDAGMVNMVYKCIYTYSNYFTGN